jgi:hypothetical protein
VAAAFGATPPAGPNAIEQTAQGTRPPATLVESFDGLGVGFVSAFGFRVARGFQPRERGPERAALRTIRKRF